jgi:hypothetical protein
MFVPIFPYIEASSSCVALLKSGSGPVRFWQFGLAPDNRPYPYAVWRRTGGVPENYLGTLPDVDSFTIQIDVFGASANSVRNVAVAIRDAIESVSYITSWLDESIDPDTKAYRFSMQNDWIVERT